MSIATMLATMVVLAPTPAHALTVTHTRDSFSGKIAWACPGRDPVEWYTLSSQETFFERDGVRLRLISHAVWRGTITTRTTGAPIRDRGNWTEIETFNANGRVVRDVLVGVVWRLTIPGHGIVVHQSGRQVFEADGDHVETPWGGIADSAGMCPYV